MEIISVIPGVKVYKDNNFSILFGCPPEIIKFLMIKNIEFPDYIVIPDKIIINDILQNCTEFPLYYHLFVLGNYSKGKKLNLIGNKTQMSNNKELLRLTLLGPTMEEYKEIGFKKDYESLYKETRYLAIKKTDGVEAQIDDFINFFPFEKNNVQTDFFTMIQKDTNVYEVNGNIVDINDPGFQNPPYEINSNYVAMMPHKFGVDILGGGSGFTPNKPSSAVLLNYNSDFMLVDCPAFLNHHLSARGISKQQIKSIYITHIHDDHCNPFPLIQFNSKLKFIGTKEIYWMTLKKISLLTSKPIDEFYSFFDFVEVEPYKVNEFYGISIIPHYTVHSIPTIGVTFLMKEHQRTYSIAISGDNKSLKDIEKMVEKGIVPVEKFEYFKKMYKSRYDLFIPDGGMGILHGDPEDSLKSQSDRVVFLHLERLQEKFDATFSMAITGKRYTLIEGKSDAYFIKTQQIFHNTFPGISDDWLTALMSNLNLINCNAGDVVFKQGEDRKEKLFLILSGICSVVYHDGQKLTEIAKKESGDFIGEMAIIKNEEKRSASIVAKTPVILCEINDELFYSFLKSENRVESIIKMWDIRKELESCYPFSSFSNYINERIAYNAVRENYKKYQIINNETLKSNFFILLDGSISIIKKDKEIKEFKKGEVFGNIPKRKFKFDFDQFKFKENSTLLKVDSNNIFNIINDAPFFNYIINNYYE